MPLDGFRPVCDIVDVLTAVDHSAGIFLVVEVFPIYQSCLKCGPSLIAGNVSYRTFNSEPCNIQDCQVCGIDIFHHRGAWRLANHLSRSRTYDTKYSTFDLLVSLLRLFGWLGILRVVDIRCHGNCPRKCAA